MERVRHARRQRAELPQPCAEAAEEGSAQARQQGRHDPALRLQACAPRCHRLRGVAT